MREGEFDESVLHWMCREEMQRLLRMCDRDGFYTQPHTSAYEKLIGFCRYYPLMDGHGTAEEFMRFLREDVGYDGGIDESMAARIWEMAVCGVTDKNTSSVCANPYKTEILQSFVPLEQIMKEKFSLAEMEKRIGESLDANEGGVLAVSLEGRRFCRSDAYHAERALAFPSGEAEENALLFWMLQVGCRELIQRNGRLLLCADATLDNTLALLAYLRMRELLPNTCILLTEVREGEAWQELTDVLGIHRFARHRAYVQLATKRDATVLRKQIARQVPIGTVCLVEMLPYR